ncbi:MAG: hypothetical protein II007_14785 [Gammaproteobacteria bacterium]|nr:hypothetical protein [Gammaproteobacteria bacterium]
MAKDRPSLSATTALTAPWWLSPLLRGLWVVAVVGLCATALPEVVALGHGVLAVMLVTIAAITLFCVTRPGRFWLLLYPALLVVALTVLIPIGHTAWLSTTNYGGRHLLGFDEARGYQLKQQYRVGDRYVLKLATTATGDTIAKIWLTPEGSDGDPAPVDDNRPADFHSPPIQLLDTQQIRDQQLSPQDLPYGDDPIVLLGGDGPAATLLTRRTLFNYREHLRALHLTLPSPQGHKLLLSDATAGLGSYTEVAPRYRDASAQQPGALWDQQLQQLMVPNWATGVFEPADNTNAIAGKPLSPAFVVPVGLANYRQLLSDPAVYRPLMQIAGWSLLYTLFTTALAALLASINAWAIRASRHPRLWLGLLVVPAAVPAVVLVLTLKGLFNQNWGEFNLLLEQSLGLRPDWFTNPLLAKVMLVMAALWLLVPLLTLWWLRLAEGLSAPRWWPLVKALWPRAKAPLLMIASVQLLAFTAISLHTGGRPDIIGAIVPSGTTDTLTSLGFRIAFEGGGGHNYGLATSLLLPLLGLALLLGHWRWRLLQQPQPDTVAAGMHVPTTAKLSALLWRLLATVITLLPFVLLVLVSLRPGNFSSGQQLPEQLTLDHWRLALDIAVTEADGSVTPPPFPLLTWLGNSLLVAGGATLAVLAIALPAARALARSGQTHWLMRLLISLQLVTPALLLVSYYSISDQIGQHWHYLGLNSHGGLVLLLLPALLLTLPPLVATFSRSPQRPLWPNLRHHWRPVAAVSLLTLLLQLGEYPVSSLLILDADRHTAAVGMQMYLYPAHTLWRDFAAAALLTSLPVMLLFYLLLPLVNRDLINHWRPL